MADHPDSDTTAQAYTDRLAALEQARWKQLLDVQAPYRWNLRRLLGEHRVLDVGCGIGRTWPTSAPAASASITTGTRYAPAGIAG